MTETDIPRIENRDFFQLLHTKSFLSEKDSRILRKKFGTDALKALVFLVKQNPSRKEGLCRAWADSIGVAYVELGKTLFQPEIVSKIPEKIAKEYKVLPVYQFGETITIATANPENKALIKDLEKAVGTSVSALFSLPSDIDKALKEAYTGDDSLENFIGKISSAALFQKNEIITPEALRDVAGNQAVIQLPICIILFAVKENATAVHIEPGLETVRIRFRVDGVLRERMSLDVSLLSALISRIRAVAGKQEDDKSLSRQGRFSFPLPDQRVEFSYSIVPAIFGEKAVLHRIGGTRLSRVPRLSQQYLSRLNLAQLTHAMKQPYGLFLVTGPRRSGKSTILYCLLDHVNTAEVNITTIENPVKYRLDGINQIQTDNAEGFDFPKVIRTCLSQDVELLMVGEIANGQTAKELTNAALSDHLILAGIQANDVFHAIIRLFQVGMEPAVAASVLIGVYCQRLVRKLCDQCKEKYSPSGKQKDLLFEDHEGEEIFFYRKKGCKACGQTGYQGRIALQEILILDNDTRKFIADTSSLVELRRRAMSSGFQDMRYDGIKKVLRGLTTLEEVNRATYSVL